MEGGGFVNIYINQHVDEGVNILPLLNTPLFIP